MWMIYGIEGEDPGMTIFQDIDHRVALVNLVFVCNQDHLVKCEVYSNPPFSLHISCALAFQPILVVHCKFLCGIEETPWIFTIVFEVTLCVSQSELDDGDSLTFGKVSLILLYDITYITPGCFPSGDRIR